MPKQLLPLLPIGLPADELLDSLAKDLSWHAGARTSAEHLWKAGLPPLATVDTLPYLFGVSQGLISHILYDRHHYYRRFEIKKSSGGVRVILAPRVALKIFQTWIHQHILSNLRYESCVTAYVPQSSILKNALPHVGNLFLLNVDIENFFPSILKESVFDIFGALGFPEPVADQLSELCTIDDRLPQGAPSSPLLANLRCAEMDSALSSLAKSENLVYTRYCDDLSFSSKSKMTSGHVSRISEVVEDHGFALNQRKTRLIGGGHARTVTGLSVVTRAMATRDKRREWRAVFHNAAKNPTAFTDRRLELLGIAAFTMQHDPTTGTRYREIARRIPVPSQ